MNTSWMCKYFEHKPNSETMTSREKMPDWPYPEQNIAARVDWDREHHYERYTTCTRCSEEMTYVRWFNVWHTKVELAAKNLREWLDLDEVTRVRDIF